MLPNSTERAVTLSGNAEQITQCIYHICCVMLEVILNTYPPPTHLNESMWCSIKYWQVPFSFHSMIFAVTAKRSNYSISTKATSEYATNSCQRPGVHNSRKLCRSCTRGQSIYKLNLLFAPSGILFDNFFYFLYMKYFLWECKTQLYNYSLQIFNAIRILCSKFSIYTIYVFFSNQKQSQSTFALLIISFFNLTKYIPTYTYSTIYSLLFVCVQIYYSLFFFFSF